MDFFIFYLYLDKIVRTIVYFYPDNHLVIYSEHCQQCIMIFFYSQGAAAGMISSHLMTLFIVIGSLSTPKEIEYLPVSTSNCTNMTFSSHIEPFFEQQYELYQSGFINKTQDDISSVLSTPGVESTSSVWVIEKQTPCPRSTICWYPPFCRFRKTCFKVKKRADGRNFQCTKKKVDRKQNFGFLLPIQNNCLG